MSDFVCKCSWAAVPHENYGACLRSKGLQAFPSATPSRSSTGRDRSQIVGFEKRLSDYRDLRKQGVTPDGTRTAQIRYAEAQSQAAGAAYDASVGGVPIVGES